jgi:P27 family predicted phage terminase small subunit
LGDDAPGHLTAAQRAIWLDVMANTAPGLIAGDHAHLLEMLCVAIDRYRTAEAAIARDGLMVRSPAGHQIQSPWLAIANKALAHARQLSADLGMSPTAAVRASVRQEAPIREPGTYDLATQTIDEFLAHVPLLPSQHLPQPTKRRNPKPN